jgi:hypothetical protein
MVTDPPPPARLFCVNPSSTNPGRGDPGSVGLVYFGVPRHSSLRLRDFALILLPTIREIRVIRSFSSRGRGALPVPLIERLLHKPAGFHSSSVGRLCHPWGSSPLFTRGWGSLIPESESIDKIFPGHVFKAAPFFFMALLRYLDGSAANLVRNPSLLRAVGW